MAARTSLTAQAGLIVSGSGRAPRLRAAVTLAASVALVALIAVADAETGYDVRLAILYLVPIAWSTWRLGALAGGLVAVAASLCWMATFSSTHPYSHAVYFYLEGGITGATFLIIVTLLAFLRRALARSDRRLLSALEQAHRTARLVVLGEFASQLAHELNQPLAAIAAYNDASLRLLRAEKADPAELAEAMQKCREQAQRAGAIIRRLREVLRRPEAVAAPQDLTDVARAALTLAEPEARAAGVALEFAAGKGLPSVRIDRLLAEQVALNLVRNAIESVQDLPAERRRVTLATARTDAGGAELSVADLGEGVPSSVREHLFEAFVTTKPGGLGLGLSICRSVIEAAGGAIRHETASRGARFVCSLPAAAV